MKKEDILAASRKENKNMDLAEAEINRYAGSLAGSVGALMCGLVSLLASIIAGRMLYAPWGIYFSMLGTSWLVRAVKRRKISDAVAALLFIGLTVLALIGLVDRLREVGA